ncbi:hypothetical protein V6N11_067574 [Hibiscus sabdariffa]|uniref:Reverse transcriptase zinc-binding domain-containing protein n=1 Tax=Hibiscus sabdariffa TaxID=183260 RepID=A0ABR2SR59_9ROSI
MRVPQRLHIFLWVVCQHKLMKNLERCHRHIGYASLCPSCDAADESSSGANESLPWSFVFVSTLWQLWKGRNDLVFNHVRMRKRNWVTDISWIPRDGNRVADMLAKLTDPSTLDIIELRSPPECLLPLLHKDAYDASFVHN